MPFSHLLHPKITEQLQSYPFHGSKLSKISTPKENIISPIPKRLNYKIREEFSLSPLPFTAHISIISNYPLKLQSNPFLWRQTFKNLLSTPKENIVSPIPKRLNCKIRVELSPSLPLHYLITHISIIRGQGDARRSISGRASAPISPDIIISNRN